MMSKFQKVVIIAADKAKAVTIQHIIHDRYIEGYLLAHTITLPNNDVVLVFHKDAPLSQGRLNVNV